MVPKVASSIRQIPEWGFSICASISSLSHQQIIRSFVRVHICLSHDVLYSDESIFLKRASFQVSNVIVSTVAPWFIFANTNMDHSFIHYMVKFLEYHMYTQDADWTKTNRTNSGEGILLFCCDWCCINSTEIISVIFFSILILFPIVGHQKICGCDSKKEEEENLWMSCWNMYRGWHTVTQMDPICASLFLTLMWTF